MHEFSYDPFTILNQENYTIETLHAQTTHINTLIVTGKQIGRAHV